MDKSCPCCSSKKIAIDDVNGINDKEQILLRIDYKCIECGEKWLITQEPYKSKIS